MYTDTLDIVVLITYTYSINDYLTLREILSLMPISAAKLTNKMHFSCQLTVFGALSLGTHRRKSRLKETQIRIHSILTTFIFLLCISLVLESLVLYLLGSTDNGIV